MTAVKLSNNTNNSPLEHKQSTKAVNVPANYFKASVTVLIEFFEDDLFPT